MLSFAQGKTNGRPIRRLSRSGRGIDNTPLFEDQYVTAKAIGVLVRAFEPCIQFVSGTTHSAVELDRPERTVISMFEVRINQLTNAGSIRNNE
ncbi:MAG: hypothetical protein Q8Q12_22010 [bacterium]|nr:hypothetical protein [bacterium]